MRNTPRNNLLNIAGTVTGRKFFAKESMPKYINMESRPYLSGSTPVLEEYHYDLRIGCTIKADRGSLPPRNLGAQACFLLGNVLYGHVNDELVRAWYALQAGDKDTVSDILNTLMGETDAHLIAREVEEALEIR